MFIVSARIPKRRLLAGAATALCCCLAILCAVLVYALRGPADPALAEVSGLRREEDQIAYLESFGWQTDGSPVYDELLIPKAFDESYDAYLALQSAQGFDLTRWCGKTVKRYTYSLSNWPDPDQKMQAALLIRRGTIIGGHLQSADGSLVLPLSGES